MNISVNVDCTPEEARRFMGLPDVTPLNDAYVARLQSLIADGMSGDGLETLMRSWSPMGEAGMAFWQKVMGAGAGK